MDQVCLVVPVLPGRTADARDFMRELEASRNADYQASEQRIGIVKEAWYLARTPAGDQLVAYLESPDVPAAFSARSRSHDEFDQWFKRRLADATGLDLNTPTAPLPELLSSYPASGRCQSFTSIRLEPSARARLSASRDRSRAHAPGLRD